MKTALYLNLKPQLVVFLPQGFAGFHSGFQPTSSCAVIGCGALTPLTSSSTHSLPVPAWFTLQDLGSPTCPDIQPARYLADTGEASASHFDRIVGSSHIAIKCQFASPDWMPICLRFWGFVGNLLNLSASGKSSLKSCSVNAALIVIFKQLKTPKPQTWLGCVLVTFMCSGAVLLT